jgi:hypothetical protein
LGGNSHPRSTFTNLTVGLHSGKQDLLEKEQQPGRKRKRKKIPLFNRTYPPLMLVIAASINDVFILVGFLQGLL